jgi:hypothetical protein
MFRSNLLPPSSLFYSEDGSSRLLRNTGIYETTLRHQIGLSGNAIGLYSVRAQFESQLRHRLRRFLVFLRPYRQMLGDRISIRSLPVPSRSFTIHRSSVIPSPTLCSLGRSGQLLLVLASTVFVSGSRMDR